MNLRLNLTFMLKKLDNYFSILLGISIKQSGHDVGRPEPKYLYHKASGTTLTRNNNLSINSC